MIYYAVIYMKDGNIHLFKCDSREEGENMIQKVRESKWKDEIDVTKVIKKDPDKEWFKSVNGYWI